jgi:ribose transport system permease protein
MPRPWGLCVALGLVVGVVNGVLIVQTRASSMIVTLAVSMILTGIVVALSQFRAPGDAPEFLRRAGAPARIWAACRCRCCCGWVRWCRRCCCSATAPCSDAALDAVGSNPQAAALSGLPHLRVVFAGHVASALVSVLCGFILVGFVGKGSITLGQDLALNSLAAAILGGVNFGSGRGGMAGPAVAAFMLTFLFNFLTSLGLGEPGRLMLQGAIIAAAALVYSRRR